MLRIQEIKAHPEKYCVDDYDLTKGQYHHKAKLTDDDVKLILALYDEGISQSELSRKFDVARQTIHVIVHRRQWRHLT
jgi:hypothetical protein